MQFIPIGGGVGTEGISSDGSTVVGGTLSPNTEAFRYTTTAGLVGLGFLPGGGFSRATGVNRDGSVVVGLGDSSAPTTVEAFLWTSSTGILALGALPGAIRSDSLGVSLDGDIVVGECDYSVGEEAFRWTSTSGMQGLGGFPGQPISSVAFATNADGSVIVGHSAVGTQIEAFRWTAQTGMVSLGLLPGAQYSGAFDVSADGNVIVGGSGSSGSPTWVRAFAWTPSTGMFALPDFPGGSGHCTAYGVSDSGLIIVGDGRSSSNGDEAVYWKYGQGPFSIRDTLTLAGVTAHFGWSLKFADAVSADGLRIIGHGVNPPGLDQGWLVTLPEPWSSYCTGKTNSLGCTPSISAAGVPSASNAWSFTLRATPVLNQSPGLFFYKVASSIVAIPFQGGTLCIGPSGIRRTPVVNSGGSPSPAQDCSGSYTLDMNAFAHGQLGGNPDPALNTPGIVYRVQAWGRDQGFAPPNNTSLSNALQVPVGP